MIDGTVTADREIVIHLEVLATNQSAVSIQAVIDTGFNGFLTQAEATSLVGMSLLWGSRVGFEAQDDGAVTIEAMSERC